VAKSMNDFMTWGMNWFGLFGDGGIGRDRKPGFGKKGLTGYFSHSTRIFINRFRVLFLSPQKRC